MQSNCVVRRPHHMLLVRRAMRFPRGSRRRLLLGLSLAVVVGPLSETPLVAQAFTVRASGADTSHSVFQRYHTALLQLGLQITSADSAAGTLAAASTDPKVAVQVTIVARADSFALTLVATPSPPGTHTDAFHLASRILHSAESTDAYRAIEPPSEAHANPERTLGFMVLASERGRSTDTLLEIKPAALPLTIGSWMERVLGGNWRQESCLRAFRSDMGYVTLVAGCPGLQTALSRYRVDGSRVSDSFGDYAMKGVLICPPVNVAAAKGDACPKPVR